jgi:hypothetical protein
MDMWGKGPALPPKTWTCIEVAFLADKPVHELHAWADGKLIHEVTSSKKDQWQNGDMKSDAWMDGKFVEVVLGWHSFSSANNEIWMDDLVLSNEPIGCQ